MLFLDLLIDFRICCCAVEYQSSSFFSILTKKMQQITVDKTQKLLRLNQISSGANVIRDQYNQENQIHQTQTELVLSNDIVLNVTPSVVCQLNNNDPSDLMKQKQVAGTTEEHHPRHLFLIEFSAGALGGAVSRTA